MLPPNAPIIPTITGLFICIFSVVTNAKLYYYGDLFFAEVYANASNVSGKLNDIQAQIRKRNQFAFYQHTLM